MRSKRSHVYSQTPKDETITPFKHLQILYVILDQNDLLRDINYQSKINLNINEYY